MHSSKVFLATTLRLKISSGSAVATVFIIVYSTILCQFIFALLNTFALNTLNIRMKPTLLCCWHQFY